MQDFKTLNKIKVHFERTRSQTFSKWLLQQQPFKCLINLNKLLFQINPQNFYIKQDKHGEK